MIFRILWSAFVTLTALGAAAQEPWNSQRTAAIVRIERLLPGGSQPSVGTGFVVLGNTNRHFVVTATHNLLDSSRAKPMTTDCVALSKEVKMMPSSGQGPSFPGKCVFHLSSGVSLIELLPLATSSQPYRTLALDGRAPVQGERLYIAGFPFGWTRLDAERSGKVTNENNDQGFAVVDVLTAGGMSGGPYVRKGGTVVGLHDGATLSASGFAHVVRLSSLRAELEALLPALPMSSASTFDPERPIDRMSPVGAVLILRQVESPELRAKLYIEMMGPNSLSPEIRQLLAVVRPDTEALSQVAPIKTRGNVAIEAKDVTFAFEDKRRVCLSGQNLTVKDGLIYCDAESQYVASPNFGQPMVPDLIVLHSTMSGDANATIKTLQNPDRRVSAHILIDRDGSFIQLVNFERQAWHAGISNWRGRSNLNKMSIGIELVNLGDVTRMMKATPGAEPALPDDQVEVRNGKIWQKYTTYQLAALNAILQAIAQKYSIQNIVGHCEVSKNRKVDPGPLLPVEKIESRILNTKERGSECSY